MSAGAAKTCNILASIDASRPNIFAVVISYKDAGEIVSFVTKSLHDAQRLAHEITACATDAWLPEETP